MARKAEPRRKRSRWEAERQRRNIILVVISLTIVSALGIVGYGYYDTRVKPWHQPIVKVNDTVLDMEYFVKMLRWSGVGQNPYTDVETAQQAAVTMISNELMKQSAEKQFGIVASEESVNGKIREIFSSEITDEDFEQKYREVLRNLAEGRLSEEDLRRLYAEPAVLSRELLNRIGDEEYPVDGLFPHVHIRAILVTGSDNATAVKERWGEDMKQLAVAFSASQYYPTTDNVEWVPRGMESSAFDDYAFGEGANADNLGPISDPIEDSEESGKFWVIQVLGSADRPLSEDHRAALTGEALNEWLDNEKKPGVNEVVNSLEGVDGYERLYWAIDHV